MAEQPKFGFLRNILKALGLSDEAVTELLDWIAALLATDQKEQAATAPSFPYRLRDDFLSPAERSFLQVLAGVVGSDAFICPKVSLNDIFYAATNDPGEYRVATNKIDRKHVDFLLCQPSTMTPLVGIELDDKSHARPDRQARDHFVNQVYAAAGLTLLHVPAQRGYAPHELAALLRPHLHLADAGDPPPAPVNAPVPVTSAAEPHAPLCPKCGAVMVLRTAKSGANQGQQFWGCPNYPRCRTIVAHASVPTAVAAR